MRRSERKKRLEHGPFRPWIFSDEPSLNPARVQEFSGPGAHLSRSGPGQRSCRGPDRPPIHREGGILTPRGASLGLAFLITRCSQTAGHRPAPHGRDDPATVHGRDARATSDPSCNPPPTGRCAPALKTPQTSPAVSGKPNQRFMICTAWPLAPLTRLSMAEVITKLPVRGSAPRTCQPGWCR